MASEIIKTVGIIALIIAALASFIVFLMKQGFKHLLAKDIEKFKSDLRLVAFEHEICFSKLHEKRMEIIAKIYSGLVSTEQISKLLVGPHIVGEESKLKDKWEGARAISNAFWSDFHKNRIYLSAELCSTIDEYYQKLSSAIKQFQIVINFYTENSHKTDKDRQSAWGAWDKAWDEAFQIIPLIKKDIEKEFRVLLGVERGS